MALPPLRNPARSPSSTRGSVGSFVVWDEASRAARQAGRTPARTATPADRPATRDLDPRIEARLRSVLERTASGLDDGDAIGARILSFVRRAAEAGSVESRVLGAHQKGPQIDVLERRIAKLEASLAHARAAISRAESRADVDRGIASLYRTVQGLAECDALLELKRDLLVRIYEANLVLQKRG